MKKFVITTVFVFAVLVFAGMAALIIDRSLAEDDMRSGYRMASENCWILARIVNAEWKGAETSRFLAYIGKMKDVIIKSDGDIVWLDQLPVSVKEGRVIGISNDACAKYIGP